jgi:hypothetical protein
MKRVYDDKYQAIIDDLQQLHEKNTIVKGESINYGYIDVDTDVDVKKDKETDLDDFMRSICIED